MWRYDFHLFYQAGQAVLAGNSPYTVVGFQTPPYPLAVIFALFAWMPEPVAYALFIGINLYMLFKVMGRNGIWALLSFPVLFDLFVGQLDLPLALITLLVGPWALPLLLIKPQVGFVLAPWVLHNITKKQIIKIGVTGLAFLGLCFLLRPTWVSEWLSVIPTISGYANRDSSLYWLVPSTYKTIVLVICSLIILPIGFYLKKQRSSWVLLQLFAPLSNIYSASTLVKWIGPVEMILSWITILLVGTIHKGAPFFFIGFSILIRYFIKDKYGIDGACLLNKASSVFHRTES